MKKYSSLIIGHVTLDRNVDHLGNEFRGAGGAVLFSSASAFALGHSVGVLTKLSSENTEITESFTIPAEDIYALSSEKTTVMENIYYTADKERRHSACLSRGDVISAKDIPEGVAASVYHIAGLLYGDYEPDIIKNCAVLGKVAVDVQGYLRHSDPSKGGEMFFCDWEEKKELLPYIDFLKTDAAEAEILTGLSDRAEAARVLYSWGAREVLITHNTEVLAFDGREIYTCPIRARNLSGRTGRGDTTFAAYINERLSRSPAEALLTATAAVSLKMETPGPLKAGRNEIEKYIKDFYGDIL